MAPNRTNLGYPPELEFAIQEAFSVLGSIEARYTDELARLEQSNTSGSAKERLRQQLESRRKSAREPHVLKLAELAAARRDPVALPPHALRPCHENLTRAEA